MNMIDIFLGLSVIIAVLLLGGLISIGNERQRKAIDSLTEQVIDWSEQDIRIKREKLAREIAVPDPARWLEGVIAAAQGVAPKVRSLSPWSQGETKALVAVCEDGRKLVLTPMPDARFVRAVTPRGRGVLAGTRVSILGDKPKKLPRYTLSVINGGMFFDIEATKAWETVTGEALPVQRLTVYEVGA